MIQRFIFDALQDGVEQISSDLTILDQLFREVYDLSDTELDAIKTFWANEGDDDKRGPPKVIHGYAPRDVKIPVYAIVLESETESLTWLNNDSGQVEDPNDPDFGADIKGSIWNHRYGIHIYHEHPDVTTYIYEIAKSILLASFEFFNDQGMFDIDVSGADMVPDPRYIPEHFFGRKLTFACQRCFTRIDRDSAQEKAFKVSGLHIDRGGSSSDVGGVKTLIKPFTE